MTQTNLEEISVAEDSYKPVVAIDPEINNAAGVPLLYIIDIIRTRWLLC